MQLQTETCASIHLVFVIDNKYFFNTDKKKLMDEIQPG